MDFYEERESRSQDAREADLLARLVKQLAHAKEHAPYYTKLLKQVDAEAVTSREALAALPVTRKGDLIRLQDKTPPFGGLAAVAAGAAARLFASPGPIFELQAGETDFWRMARALYAAGFRAGELVHNAFSYHLTPGGWILDGGARALGCAVIPAGVGNSQQQVEAIAHFRPQGYTGTPDFLKVLLDHGREARLNCRSIVKALVSGGALFPAMRQEYADRGVAVLQCYATADLGLIAYESPAKKGMILDEDIIVEVVRPGTGTPLPEGEVGEVVVTTLNPAYPLIRFATGDLSALMPGRSPCGRTAPRIRGWMGRADQAAKVRGMFVQPSQVGEVLKRHPDIRKARLVVARHGDSDVMTLRCEVEGPRAGRDSRERAAAIAEDLRDCCKVRGEVELLSLGVLPNDGKVIDDQRSYD